MQRLLRLTLGLAIAGLTTSAVWGQVPYSSGMEGIAASATEKIPVKPDKIRLTLWFQAQGKDVKSAMAALNEQKEKVKKELETMKIEKDTLKFSSPRIVPRNTSSRQMMMMGGNGEATNPPPTLFTAMEAVRGEWALPVKEGDALAMLPATLKEQISVRDLSGRKAKPKLNAEELEQFEELQAMMQERYMYDDRNSEMTQIEFVATVAESDYQTAFSKAFQNASKEAQILAQSAGVKIGKMKAITKTSNSDDDFVEYYGRRYSGGDPTYATPEVFGTDTGIVVTAENADELSLKVTIGVIYHIE